MYSNNLILLSHRKENLIKESNRKNQQKKKNHHTKLHKVIHKICPIKRDISDALFIGNERDPKGLKRDSKRN